MSSETVRVFTRGFEFAAIERMRPLVDMFALARELRVRRKPRYAWRDAHRKSGAEALRGRGRPRTDSWA